MASHHVRPGSTHFDNDLKMTHVATSLPLVVHPLWEYHS